MILKKTYPFWILLRFTPSLCTVRILETKTDVLLFNQFIRSFMILPVFDNNAVFCTVQTFAQLTMHPPSGSINDKNLKANLLQRNKRNLSPLFLSHPILLIE